MADVPGASLDLGESGDQSTDDSGADVCDACGAELEWTLDVDGTQHKECPRCDD